MQIVHEPLVDMIEPLSIKNIEKTQELLQSIFPYCKSRKYPPEKSVYLSLVNDKNYFEEESIKEEEFFIVRSGEEIIGTTGLTVYQQDKPFSIWLGWFCVNPVFRGNGFGSQLLTWTLKRVQERRFQNLLVETSDHENEAEAQRLYESLGINVFKTAPAPHIGTGENIIIYRQLSLV